MGSVLRRCCGHRAMGDEEDVARATARGVLLGNFRGYVELVRPE